ncbi:MAG: hypothetical protein ACI9K5_003800, partial [Gammaproteobacteria bacterium]
MSMFSPNKHLSRRDMLRHGAAGLAAASTVPGLKGMGHAATQLGLDRSSSSGLPGLPHHTPKAKRLIYLFQNGAPTHVDLFDYKPTLVALHGKPVPEEFIAGKRFSTMTGSATGKLLLGPISPFHQRGESGAWVSDLMPYTAEVADELCFIKGLHTEAVNHAP